MKAYISGGHYLLYIDENKEYPLLINGLLEATLQKETDGSDLQKKVSLRCKSNAKNNEVNFSPSGASWDNLKEISIIITKEEYNRLGINRSDVIRFSVFQSIDIYLENDISNLI